MNNGQVYAHSCALCAMEVIGDAVFCQRHHAEFFASAEWLKRCGGWAEAEQVEPEHVYPLALNDFVRRRRAELRSEQEQAAMKKKEEA